MGSFFSSTFWSLLKSAGIAWIQHEAPRFGAALGFYTLFAVSPLVLIGVTIAGSIFGTDTARAELLEQVRILTGPAGADVVEAVMKSAAGAGRGVTATVIAAVTLIAGATSVFVELQDALNTIWGVQPRPGRAVTLFLRKRLFSFVLVLGIGILLLVSVILSTVLAAFSEYFSGHEPGTGMGWQAVAFKKYPRLRKTGTNPLDA